MVYPMVSDMPTKLLKATFYLPLKDNDGRDLSE